MGFPRRDYLYDMEYWEILHLIRGYRKRHILHYEMQRLIAFYSAFAFSGNKNNTTLEEFCPLYFDDHSEENITDDEINEMRQMIIQENERIAREKSEQ